MQVRRNRYNWYNEIEELHCIIPDPGFWDDFVMAKCRNAKKTGHES
jgi:hypothetical protein